MEYFSGRWKGLSQSYDEITYLTNLHSCIVHVDNFKFFICPTNEQNSYKIVKLLKSFKIVIFAPSCFGLHKSSSGGALNLCFAKVKMLILVRHIVI